MNKRSTHVASLLSLGMCLTIEVREMVVIAGEIKEEVLVLVRDYYAVRSRLPLALGGAVVTGTMVEVVGTRVEPFWGQWHGMVFISS